MRRPAAVSRFGLPATTLPLDMLRSGQGKRDGALGAVIGAASISWGHMFFNV